MKMWGNLPGWVISGVMLVAAGGAIYQLEQLDQTTPATALGQDRQNLARLTLPVPVVSVATFMTSPTCDSGQFYRDAIEAYLKDPKGIDAFVESPGMNRIPRHSALDLIRRGTSCHRAKIFIERPEEVVNYDQHRKPLAALHALGNSLVRSGMLLRKDRPGDAKADLEAAFSLGYKLFEERLVYEQLSNGLALMDDASRYLAEIAEAEGNTARAQELRQFRDSLREFSRERVEPMWAVISPIGEQVIARHAGDVLLFAEQSQEPVWQNESILKLGRYQHHSTRRSDQVAATRAVRELAADPDPVISAAGRAARDLTIEQYRQLGR